MSWEESGMDEGVSISTAGVKMEEKAKCSGKVAHCPRLGFTDPKMNPGSPQNQGSPAT